MRRGGHSRMAEGVADGHTVLGDRFPRLAPGCSPVSNPETSVLREVLYQSALTVSRSARPSGNIRHQGTKRRAAS